jgi:hypothetical protein
MHGGRHHDADGHGVRLEAAGAENKLAAPHGTLSAVHIIRGRGMEIAAKA